MLKKEMQVFAESIAAECKKKCAPTTQNSAEINTTINMICVKAIKFRQQKAFGILGVVTLIKLIRKQLKNMDYTASFINESTLYLVQALMRMR